MLAHDGRLRAKCCTRKRAERTGDARMRGERANESCGARGLMRAVARAGPALSARTDGESTKLIKQMLDGDLAVNGTKGGWCRTRNPACRVSCAASAVLARISRPLWLAFVFVRARWLALALPRGH